MGPSSSIISIEKESNIKSNCNKMGNILQIHLEPPAISAASPRTKEKVLF
jgi:hypothetical protein